MSMTFIERIEVGSGGAASVTFSAIPDTFTDLLVVVSARQSEAIPFMGLGLNGLTDVYSSRVLYGVGATVGSNSHTTSVDYGIWGYISISSYTASTFGSTSIYIPNYRSSTNKSVSLDSVAENNATEGRLNISAGLANITDPITSLSLVALSGSLAASGLLVEHSSATLYGITAGSDGTTTVS